MIRDTISRDAPSGGIGGAVPLTLTLSLGEREQAMPLADKFDTRRGCAAWGCFRGKNAELPSALIGTTGGERFSLSPRERAGELTHG